MNAYGKRLRSWLLVLLQVWCPMPPLLQGVSTEQRGYVQSWAYQWQLVQRRAACGVSICYHLFPILMFQSSRSKPPFYASVEASWPVVDQEVLGAQAKQLQLVLHLGRQRRKRYILMLRNKLTVKNICRMTYSKPTSFLVTQHIVFSGEASWRGTFQEKLKSPWLLFCRYDIKTTNLVSQRARENVYERYPVLVVIPHIWGVTAQA